MADVDIVSAFDSLKTQLSLYFTLRKEQRDVIR